LRCIVFHAREDFVTAAVKPELVVDLDASVSPAPLRASALQASLKQHACYHEIREFRHPLGIYNLSIARILRNTSKCARRLERLLVEYPVMTGVTRRSEEIEDVLDYLELSLYSAAEHVDDLEFIASCFFPTNEAYKRSSSVRQLKTSMKPIRYRISGFANAIKHNHARIRMYSIALAQNSRVTSLHGFFLESYYGGAASPSPVFHSKGEHVISINAFLWEIVIYLFLMSNALCDFLRDINAIELSDHLSQAQLAFQRTITSLARLPLYSFDDEPPFKKTRVIILGGASARNSLKSELYGSICDPWDRNSLVEFGQGLVSSEGDGATKSFTFMAPEAIKLSYWD
jgi:hypothetical protein